MTDFISEILCEQPHISLIKNHFCIVDLSKNTSQFSEIINLRRILQPQTQCLFNSSTEIKKNFVCTTDNAKNVSTANSLYGYSAISNHNKQTGFCLIFKKRSVEI